MIKSLFLLTLGCVAEATFVGTPKCWKSCAREVGLNCGWADISCWCKAVNAGYVARANSCACGACAADTYGVRAVYDVTTLSMKELWGSCKFTRNPMAQGVYDAAIAAASCENGNNGSPPPAPAPVPVAIPEGPPPPPLIAPPPPPAVDDIPNVSYLESKTVIVPIVTEVPIPQSSTSYAYATLTVPVKPVPAVNGTPISELSTKSTGTGTPSAKPASKSSSSSKTAQSTGGAVRNDNVDARGLTGSMLALAAAVMFGIA